MADRVSVKQRSAIMAKVGTKNTGPEMLVRRALHGIGYRYTLHDRQLPGKPDIVFRRRRKVIFVHGCFWHGHACRWGKLPKSRPGYWKPKMLANKKRDRNNRRKLTKMGWRSIVVWQCELKQFDKSIKKIIDFLEEKA